MILTLVKSLSKLKDFKGTYSEKISIFFALIRLQIKGKLFKSKNKLVRESFINYKVFGYNYLNLSLLINEVFISNEYYFQPLTKDPVIIDCGANIGVSILYFKKLFPNSRILAFEPNPHAFELLQKNMKENKIQNVELFNIALLDDETEIPFYISDDISTLMGSIKRERGGIKEFKIKTQRLSYYLRNFEMVDLIKMDVEGAELNILSDLVESFSINKTKEYIIEYHHNIDQDKSALSFFLQKFEENGFNYNIQSYFRNINTFQDILIHFYKK